LWTHAETHTPGKRFDDFTQAIMDLGATLCRRTRPDCSACPLSSDCAAYLADDVASFPGRKAGKNKPVRQSRMFLLHDAQGSVLLEQRPASGIWGGLWAPPERPADTTLAQIAGELGLSVETLSAERVAPVFRHTFTHFHLDIEPVYAVVRTLPAQIRDGDGWRWHQPGSNEAFGLPAPAVKLLRTLEEFALI
jgi:A/G-specific adenine glycosylase